MMNAYYLMILLGPLQSILKIDSDQNIEPSVEFQKNIVGTIIIILYFLKYFKILTYQHTFLNMIHVSHDLHILFAANFPIFF